MMISNLKYKCSLPPSLKQHMFYACVAGLALMLIAAAVTLGKLWGAEPHFSPSTEYTGAQTNSWRDTALSLYFLQYFIIKTSHKINNFGYRNNLQHYHHAPTTE